MRASVQPVSRSCLLDIVTSQLCGALRFRHFPWIKDKVLMLTGWQKSAYGLSQIEMGQCTGCITNLTSCVSCSCHAYTEWWGRIFSCWQEGQCLSNNSVTTVSATAPQPPLVDFVSFPQQHLALAVPALIWCSWVTVAPQAVMKHPIILDAVQWQRLSCLSEGEAFISACGLKMICNIQN